MIKIQRFEKSAADPAHEGTILAMDVLLEGIEAPL